MTKKRKKVFHIGDKIVVTGKRFIEKIGYERDFTTELYSMIEECTQGALIDLMNPFTRIWESHLEFSTVKQVGPMLYSLLPSVEHFRVDRFIETLVRDRVYERLCQRLKSGTARKLFFQGIQKDQYFANWVQGKKIVYTGTYRAGTSSWDDNDCEPPELLNRTAHILLKVCLHSDEVMAREAWVLENDCITWADWEGRKAVLKRVGLGETL